MPGIDTPGANRPVPMGEAKDGVLRGLLRVLAPEARTLLRGRKPPIVAAEAPIVCALGTTRPPSSVMPAWGAPGAAIHLLRNPNVVNVGLSRLLFSSPEP